MTYNESLNKEITTHFNRASILDALIKKNVESVANNVCSGRHSGVECMTNAKLGSCEAWIERLTTMLSDKEIEYLIGNLEKE